MEAAMMEVTPEVSTCYSDDPDLPLIEACANGDVTAFDELVRRYDCKLLRIARQVTNNQEDAEEAVQETFLKVYQKLNQFQRNSKFSTWLIRIALNESFMKLRRRRFSEVPLDYEDADGEVVPKDLTDWSPNPEQMCSRTELQEILRSALETLPSALRVVFVLRDIEEISIKETAAILNLNIAAVKARLYRARLRLREKLSKHFRQPSA
jgi:RNA polymerase sigma-70 factor, ECF subfamily